MPKAASVKNKNRWLILVLAVMLAALAPAGGRCCSLGGGASYDYLGDTSLSIDMESYDDFLRDNTDQSSLTTPTDSDQEAENTSRLSLNLSDNGSIELSISRAAEKFAGEGNLKRMNETVALLAEGNLQESRLLLNATALLSGEVYRFNLEREGSRILGDYSRTSPDGREANGTAEGWWEG